MAADLTSVYGFPFEVKASADFGESAENSAKLCMRAKEKLDSIFGFSPLFTLYVLDKQDWPAVASLPIYGIPHYDARRIVISAEKSEIGQKNVDLIQQYDPDATKSLQAVYANDSGEIDLSSFYFTLVVHELGHAFGLIHCSNPVCVMRSSTYVEDLDQKHKQFCFRCRAELNRITDLSYI